MFSRLSQLSHSLKRLLSRAITHGIKSPIPDWLLATSITFLFFGGLASILAYQLWQSGFVFDPTTTGFLTLFAFGPSLLVVTLEAIGALFRLLRTLGQRCLATAGGIVAPTARRASKGVARFLAHLSRPWVEWSSRNILYRILGILEPEFIPPTIDNFQPDRVPAGTWDELELHRMIIARYQRLLQLWPFTGLLAIVIPATAVSPIVQLVGRIPQPVGSILAQAVSMLAVLYGFLAWRAIALPLVQRRNAWIIQAVELMQTREAQNKVAEVSGVLGDKIQAVYADYLLAVQRIRLTQQERVRLKEFFEWLDTCSRERREDTLFAFKALMDAYRGDIAKSAAKSEFRGKILDVVIEAFFAGLPK